MRRLSERDASAALTFVRELVACDDVLPFPPRIVAALQTLIPSDSTAYSELDPARGRSVLQVWHNANGEDRVAGGPIPHEQLWWQLRHTHPLCGYRSASGDWTTARRVSDFATLREFRRTAIYDAFYRGSIDHWLDVGLAPEPTRTRCFIFNRYGRPDFDERDRLVADLLQPHLARRAGAADDALRAAAALAALEGEAVGEAHRVVLCSGTGVIEFGSASSRALLQRYLGLENGRLPGGLLCRRKLRLEHGERRLDIRIVRTGGLYLLLLDERDTRIERLTERERQILELVVVGKENEAIALELGIAPATVAKHLEHAYRKLGVPNRTAAARLLAARPAD